MALITEVADEVYEIKPEGRGLDCFPLCTVYLVVDEKKALIEAGCPVQAPEILEAVEKLGYGAKELSYIIPTHVHGDHAGGAGLLAQRMPQAQVMAHPRAAKFLADSSMIARLMQGFKQIFGEDAEERLGRMPPVPQEKFSLVEDGESIQLGGRELNVIDTSGHAPYHFSFLDTKTRGLFCGDAFGGYFSDIEVIFPSSTLGSDPILTLQSMEKLQGLNPELVFFSHGSSTREAAKIIQLGVEQARQCQDIALNGLKAGEDLKEIACRLIEVLARGSALARSALLNWPYLILVTVEGYQQYFKKNNMI
ncbi:MAG: MBL fold metallo-hydrolase [Desulfobacteraceae bacterium]|jgi:glyoxylase-like metal-dependent hydrolase (beta-lactamase superfamily II)